MGIQFMAQIPAAAWTSACAFDPRTHATYDDAVTAHRSHDPRGCEPAHNFTGDDSVFAAEHPHGLYPDHCITTPWPCEIPEAQPPTEYVNLSHSWTGDFLELLGYSRDLAVGSAPAAEMLGRALTALGVAPTDPGTATTVTVAGEDHAVDAFTGTGFTTPNGPVTLAEARIVSCGRPAGHYDQKLTELAELARWADQHDYQIIWS